MKIALIGYGKMGRAIEEIALQRGHEIVLKVNIDNLEDNTIENIRKADVAIEFYRSEALEEGSFFQFFLEWLCASTCSASEIAVPLGASSF